VRPTTSDDPTQCPANPDAPVLALDDPVVDAADEVEPAEDFAAESEAPEPPD
jgi:hypothetical protein